jgi:hypothetical protein
MSSVYDYPIKPGTVEWKEFITHEQMVNACQIPLPVLKSMDTKELIETCLSYPLFGDIYAYDKIQQGFEAVSSHFNGIQELLQRKDAGALLIHKYKGMDPSAFDLNWSLEKRNNHIANFCYIEILIAQEEILLNLHKNQKQALLQDCILKTQEKVKYPEVYGMISLRNVCLITGRILLTEKFEPILSKSTKDDKLQTFLENGYLPDVSLVEELLSLAIQYLNVK